MNISLEDNRLSRLDLADSSSQFDTSSLHNIIVYYDPNVRYQLLSIYSLELKNCIESNVRVRWQSCSIWFGWINCESLESFFIVAV